jgi:protoheme IX farnesyltransferase
MNECFSDVIESDNVVDCDSTVCDYFSLLKPCVLLLVVFSGLTGELLACGNVHPFVLWASVFSIAMGAGAAGAINMWYDRDIDAIMCRTSERPVPKGRIAPSDALIFGVVMGLSSLIVMGLTASWFVSFLLFCSITFYVVVYTVLLKRFTHHNIVIGGIAGAFPPVIGDAVVTGHISFEALLIALIIFVWTPPHFWSLAIHYRDDYKNVKIPMLPAKLGLDYTKWSILVYSVALLVVSYIPVSCGILGKYYFISATILGCIFIYHAINVYRYDSPNVSRNMFRYSILYMFVLLASMLADRFLF